LVGAGGALVLGEALTPTPIGSRALALVGSLDATNEAMDISGALSRRPGPVLPPSPAPPG
jgi:hypothetical protein